MNTQNLDQNANLFYNNINVIGDIHGRDTWKQLVKNDCINVFVGDYFDPYNIYTVEQLLENFMDIIIYKEEHPDNVILLLGNHDAHYLDEYCLNGESSRYDSRNHEKFQTILKENIDLFYGVVYYHEPTKSFISHAGLSNRWFIKHFNQIEQDPKQVEEIINKLWSEKPVAFTFGLNCSSPIDYYGESYTHSPIWIRPESLIDCNYFEHSDIEQIVGHTQVAEIYTSSNNITLVDVLGTINKSYTKYGTLGE